MASRLPAASGGTDPTDCSSAVIASRSRSVASCAASPTASAARSPTSIGAPYATRRGPNRFRRSVPAIPAGTSGTPASSAMRAAPVCQRASYRFRSPFARLVPSGNITTACPERQRATAVSIASWSRVPRSTRKPPPARTIQPSGGQKSSFFAMKRRNRRGKSGTPSGHGSKFDQWFAASTHPPSGTFSRPVQRRR